MFLFLQAGLHFFIYELLNLMKHIHPCCISGILWFPLNLFLVFKRISFMENFCFPYSVFDTKQNSVKNFCELSTPFEWLSWPVLCFLYFCTLLYSHDYFWMNLRHKIAVLSTKCAVYMYISQSITVHIKKYNTTSKSATIIP